MTGQDWIFFVVFLVVLVILGQIIGKFLCGVLDPAGKTFLDFILKPLERGTYKICRIDPVKQMEWKEYLLSILAFSLLAFLFTFAIILFQKFLPLNPNKLGAPSLDLIFNIAVSYVTNTNWQSYAGESTLSYFSQMAALTVQNFVSAAVGLSAVAAIIRGLINKDRTNSSVGNFWVDLVRISYYLLLPLSVCLAVLYMWQGSPQNFSAPVEITALLDKSSVENQTIIQGPVASQEAIKLIGTNGGGYAQANSAHPYENPTPLSNFFQMLSIALIPISQLFYFGRRFGNKAHANWIFGGLIFLFILGAFFCTSFEYKAQGINHLADVETVGNMEGKETRFGIFSSTLFTNVSTTIACGAVNSALDSYTPIGGLVPLMNIDYGEIIFGGIGSGLYTIILYAILSVFIAGLIIGRTPEYLGKKIEPRDMKLITFSILIFIFVIALFSYLALNSDIGRNSLSNHGPHGISEILYAYSSCTANNGSAFGGLHSDNVFYNVTTALAMLFGRYFSMSALIALGGFFAGKKFHPITKASFPMTGFIFLILFIGIIVLFGSLTFLPLLVFGPVFEFFAILNNMLFGAIFL